MSIRYASWSRTSLGEPWSFLVLQQLAAGSSRVHTSARKLIVMADTLTAVMRTYLPDVSALYAEHTCACTGLREVRSMLSECR